MKGPLCSTVFIFIFSQSVFLPVSADQADFWRKLVVILSKKSNSFSIEVDQHFINQIFLLEFDIVLHLQNILFVDIVFMCSKFCSVWWLMSCFSFRKRILDLSLLSPTLLLTSTEENTEELIENKNPALEFRMWCLHLLEIIFFF